MWIWSGAGAWWLFDGGVDGVDGIRHRRAMALGDFEVLGLLGVDGEEGPGAVYAISLVGQTVAHGPPCQGFDGDVVLSWKAVTGILLIFGGSLDLSSCCQRGAGGGSRSRCVGVRQPARRSLSWSILGADEGIISG